MVETNPEESDESTPPDPMIRLAFVMNVHRLLQNGFDHLTGDHHEKKEEEITGALVVAIERVLDDPKAPEWVTDLTVHEEKPKNEAQRSGKKRLKLDFEFERTGRGPRPRFVMEAKRLGPAHPVGGKRGYLSPEGMGAFLSGEYAGDYSDAGMLGYMQSHTPEHWRDQLATELGKSPGKYAVGPGGEWKAITIVNGPPMAYRSVHSRAHSRKAVAVYHTLLDFRYTKAPST